MTKPEFNPKSFLAATELSLLENQSVRGGKKKYKQKGLVKKPIDLDDL